MSATTNRMTNEEEINKHFKEIIRLCKIAGIIGTNTTMGKYYVKFSFEPKKRYCGKCGRSLE